MVNTDQKQRGICVKHILTLILILIPTLLSAGHVPTVCNTELASWIKAKQALSIVDIQSAEDFRAHNYSDSLATGNNRLRLKKIADRLQSTNGKVVVVSASGGADALQATEQLVRGGVKRSRILVLEGGMEAAVKNAACECCKPSSLQGTEK